MSRYDDNSEITLTFNDGSERDFTVVASGIQYRGKTYSLLQPVDMYKMKDNEVYVCSVTTNSKGNDIYTLEDNDSRSDAVIREYNRSLGGSYQRGSALGNIAQKAGKGLAFILKAIGVIVALGVGLFCLVGLIASSDTYSKVICGIFLAVDIVAVIAVCILLKRRKK